MMNQNDAHQLIQAYEDGTLSKKDRLDFEKQLKTDDMLAKTWQLNQEVNHAIRNAKALEMETLLDTIGNEFVEKYKTEDKSVQTIKKSRIRSIYPWAIAVSFALIIGFIWWQFCTTTSVNAQTLYAESYTPYSSSVTIRSTNGTADTAFQEGQKKYQIGEYQAAIALFSIVLNSDSLSDESAIATHFYKGMAHMGQEDFEVAKQELELVLSKSGHVYTQQAQWYLALLALKNQDIEQAKKALRQTITTTQTGKYGQQAATLLKKLE